MPSRSLLSIEHDTSLRVQVQPRLFQPSYNSNKHHSMLTMFAWKVLRKLWPRRRHCGLLWWILLSQWGEDATMIKCPMGYYCPNGSAAKIPCTRGWYCAHDGLSAPTYQCAPGSYCTLNSSSATPRDGVTGNICPRGKYCPLGTAVPNDCPIGMFLNSTGNV